MAAPSTAKKPDTAVIIVAAALGGVVIVGFLIYFLAFGGGPPAPDADTVWFDTRRVDLEGVAKRLTEYAAAHGSQFPRDRAELSQAGIVPAERFKFRDPQRDVEVQRQYRPATITGGDSKVILLLENYEPNALGSVLAVYSDGQVMRCPDLQTTIRDDNELRKALKMREIPWAPP